MSILDSLGKLALSEGNRAVALAHFEESLALAVRIKDPSGEAWPLAKIASGGEISRVMLALKTALNRIDQIPTQVYDEIDVGIGGRTADIIGEKLKRLSKQRQVICITHLPQIARFADRHFRVEKHVIGTRTVISAKQLTDEERIDEIARMHGGEATVTTLAHARELLLSSRR